VLQSSSDDTAPSVASARAFELDAAPTDVLCTDAPAPPLLLTAADLLLTCSPCAAVPFTPRFTPLPYCMISAAGVGAAASSAAAIRSAHCSAVATRDSAPV